MKKFMTYGGIRILVLLCILLGCRSLTTENAWAAEAPLNKDVTVSDAEASFNNVSEMRDKALEAHNLILAQKALEDAGKAALQLTVLSENFRLMAEIGNARMTVDIAGQTADVVTDIVTMPRKGVTTPLSYTGAGTGNIGLAVRSLDVAERLGKLVWSFDRMSLERRDSELKQTVRKAAQSIRAAIKAVSDTASYIAGTSENAEEISLAKELKDRSQNIQYSIIDGPECIDPDCDPPASAV